MNRRYFDHNATTPIAERVLEAHTRALREVFGNPSSIHQDGQHARALLEDAREQVARRIGAEAKSIVFCSGGTEADNTAIFGAIRGREKAHVITTAIEHPAVLQACGQLDATYVRVGAAGVVDPDEIRRALRPDTALISVMHANNEIGTIQPVAEIAAVAREAGVPIHSDGVQAVGRIDVDVRRLGITFYAISGHKLYAPKGIGALYVEQGSELQPLLFGGRHENGRRAGTENVPGAVALGAAATLASRPSSALRDRFEQQVLDRIPHVRVNGMGSPRIPNTSSLMIEGVEGEATVIALDLMGFAVSSGAACSSGAVEPSHVLTAIGLSRRQAKSCIRVSLGTSNTEEDVDALVDALVSVTARLRRVSTDVVAHA